jgi:hypothetical protein
LRISDVSYMATHVYLVGDARVKPCLNPWGGLWDEVTVVAHDAAGHYRQLLQLGRQRFLAAAAPAALVRYRKQGEGSENSGVQALTLDDDREDPGGVSGEYVDEETLPFGTDLPDQIELEVYPLTKKPGASFPDRITIGRTANNDLVIADSSISRLHAYVKRDGSDWVVADGGSRNGSWLRGAVLVPRKEQPLASRALLRFGDVDVTFYLAADLYAALGGT